MLYSPPDISLRLGLQVWLPCYVDHLGMGHTSTVTMMAWAANKGLIRANKP